MQLRIDNPETQAKLGTRYEDKQNEKHNTKNLKAITLIKPEPLYEQLPENTLKWWLTHFIIHNHSINSLFHSTYFNWIMTYLIIKA